MSQQASFPACEISSTSVSWILIEEKPCVNLPKSQYFVFASVLIGLYILHYDVNNLLKLDLLYLVESFSLHSKSLFDERKYIGLV